MPSPDDLLEPGFSSRLYLMTPPAHDAAQLADAFGAACSVAELPAVLLRLPVGDERSSIRIVKALAPVVQERGTALLIDGHADLVVRAGADGAQLNGVAAFKEAVDLLKPARIAGCGGLHTRHDAMVVAEAGADYVLFGEPDEKGRRPSLEAVIERVAWWAEVFEVPCVAYAGSLEEVVALATAGADFIAAGTWIFEDARGPAAAVSDAVARLRRPELAT